MCGNHWADNGLASESVSWEGSLFARMTLLSGLFLFIQAVHVHPICQLHKHSAVN